MTTVRRSSARRGDGFSWCGAVALATLVVVLGRPTDVRAQAFLPEDNLAYPVQVAMTGGGGSGFFVRRDRTLYFVTAGHVLFDQQT